MWYMYVCKNNKIQDGKNVLEAGCITSIKVKINSRWKKILEAGYPVKYAEIITFKKDRFLKSLLCGMQK